jgi:hypothetical protein
LSFHRNGRNGALRKSFGNFPLSLDDPTVTSGFGLGISDFQLGLAASQHSNYHPTATALEQARGRCAGRTARGHHIIDQEYVFADYLGPPGTEGPADIGSALGGTLLSLGRGVSSTTQPARPARQPEPLGQAVGQGFALVKTSLPASPPMEWHRDHYLHTQVAQLDSSLGRPQSAGQLGQVFSGPPFHP